MRWKKVFMLGAGLLVAFTTCGATLERPTFPSLISALNDLESLEFCGERVPLEIQQVRERMEKELLLTLGDRPQVILWLKRSRRYLPHIENMLKKGGLPEDLKYVAIAESALRAHVSSPKAAVGFWQFMVHTGRRQGLTINDRIDERRNLFLSTEAAIRYFKELHEKLGSWTLAAAGYNMGEEGLMAEILEQETKDYYQLYLPDETQRFIFRILSAKLVVLKPEKYGFKLAEEDYYPPLEFDQVQVKCLQEVPIRIVARAAKTRFKVIKGLNPEVRGHYFSKGTHTILIPKGSSKGFQRRFDRLAKEFWGSKSKRIYVVKAGDNLSTIAAKFNVPLPALIIWNRLDFKRPIYPGDRLIIHP